MEMSVKTLRIFLSVLHNSSYVIILMQTFGKLLQISVGGLITNLIENQPDWLPTHWRLQNFGSAGDQGVTARKALPQGVTEGLAAPCMGPGAKSLVGPGAKPQKIFKIC